MHDIRINCKRVYDVGINFNEEASKLIEIKNNLTGISNRVKEAWTGDDRHNFLESFDAHIYELENIANYLKDDEKLLKNIALCHAQINEDFAKQTERSGEDEHRV